MRLQGSCRSLTNVSLQGYAFSTKHSLPHIHLGQLILLPQQLSSMGLCCLRYMILYVFIQRSMAQQVCYWPDGSKIYTGPSRDCYASQDSHCCGEEEVCLSNGLCYSPAINLVYAYCTSGLVESNTHGSPDVPWWMYCPGLEQCYFLPGLVF